LTTTHGEPSSGRSSLAHWAVAACVIVVAFVLGLTPVRSSDVWIHLATGRAISESGSAPTENLFSFAEPARRVISHSWLFQLMAFKLHSIVGLSGMVIVKALMGSVAVGLLFQSARARGAGLVSSAGVTGLALIAVAPRMTLRPEVVSFVCFALMIFLMEQYRKRATRWVWTAPLLMLLWGNSHGSAVVGCLIPLGYVLARLIDSALGRNEHPPAGSTGALAIVAAACLIAPAVNPYGFETLMLPLSHYRTMAEGGFKRFFMDRRSMELADLSDAHWPFAVMVALGLVGMAADWKRVQLTDLAWFFGFGGLAVTSVRFASVFAVLNAPGISIHLCRAASIVCGRLSRMLPKAYPRPVAAGLVMAAILAVGVFRPGSERLGIGLKPNTYPIRELRFLDENDIGGPLLNSFEFGGYIIWNDFPGRKVFVDTRGPVAFSPELYFRALEMIEPDREKSLAAWNELTARYGFNAALVRRESIVRHFRVSDDWVPVHIGAVAAVFVKKTKVNERVIARFGYDHVKPGIDRIDLERLARDTAAAPDVEAELRRWLRESEGQPQAGLLLGYWLDLQGRDDEAVEQYKQLVQEFPRSVDAYLALANLYADKGDLDQAEGVIRRAIAVSPDRDEPRLALKQIQLRRKQGNHR